ncbi:peptidoglycan-binding protein [Kitasatospora viridis]|uniref:N-acetylmuramoyl-L-alanine amidase n=1 Tax=Kitasatospora viridis TaxID=281105 RepID=A0A561SA02_9ACTN|nr:peptidoglycan-binding protein [Kitasatospora viridis]TWF71677.1 hypothetical protein FHX73_1848 [Kitasatospora viridis]
MQLITRAQLGWPASAAADQPTTQGVKIHYEGTPVSTDLLGDHSRCIQEWQSIRASHLANKTENWVDVAYNYASCQHGYVLEGRGIGKRTGANGNQQLNRDHYAVVALIGSEGLTQPTDALLGALRDAIELLQANGAGPEIKGHRDGYPTECPGDPLYSWVQAGAPRPGGTSPAPQPEQPPTPAIARYQVTIDGQVYGYGAHGDQVTRVGQALVARGFGSHYQVGPGPDWTDADTLNYADYQRSLGYSGAAADGVPGEQSLHQLLDAALEPFPGQDFFHDGQHSDVITRMGQRLVALGFSQYRVGPGPDWGPADQASYAAFQRSLGYSGDAADGIPGPTSWAQLRVPAN